MNIKKLFILVVILAALVATALVMQRRETSGADLAGKPVVPAYDLNAVTRVEIIRPDSTNAVRKADGKWMVESLYNYPANFKTIAQHVRTLSEIKAGPLVHGGKDFPQDFGLTDAATRVALEDSEGNALATYVIGKSRENGSGHYMLAGNGEVVLVDAGLGFLPDQGDDWIDKELLDVKAETLQQIRVSGGTNAAVTVTLGEANAYTIEGLAEGEEVNSGGAGRLSRALQYLRLQTVADPALNDEATGLKEAVTYTAVGKNGLTYTVKTGGEKDGNRFARVAVTFSAPPAPTREQAEAGVPPKGEEETDEAWSSRVQEELDRLTADHTKALEEADQEMLRLGELTKWTFLINSYNAESLRLSRKDVVQQVENEDDDKQDATESKE